MNRRACILLTLLCLACDHEDDSLAEEGTMKTLLDDVSRTTANVSAKLNDTSGSENLFITAKFAAQGTTTPELMISAYTNVPGQFVAGEYSFGSETDPGPHEAVCFYSLNDGNPPYGTVYIAQPDVGKVTITQFDRTEMVLSGTFEATVGRNDEVKRFTKGSFTKIPVTTN